MFQSVVKQQIRRYRSRQASFQCPPAATTKVLCSATLRGRCQPPTLGLLSLKIIFSGLFVLPIPSTPGMRSLQKWNTGYGHENMQVSLVNSCLALPGGKVFSGWLSPRHFISRDQVGSTCPRAWVFTDPPGKEK